MNFRVFISWLGISAALAAGGGSAWADDVQVFHDPVCDAVIRRTDACNCDPVNPNWVKPDVRRVTISAWQSPTASTDPYSGSSTPHNSANLARIDVVLRGVVCPPGPIGLGDDPYEPDRFGDGPIYGFFELDLDNNRDTGGETPNVAATRYLANAARFGYKPYGSIGDRAAVSGKDLFQPWTVSPRVCLTGADWVIAFCGCFPITVVERSNPAHQKFQAGDTWIVEGRFFQRSGAQQWASLMTGGSAPGLYDPITKMRFSHNTTTDETTISLVVALNQTGAGLLCGAPPEPMDLNAGNQTSIAEGLSDLITGAISRPLTGLTRAVTIEWAGQPSSDATNPSDWECRFIVGTTYASPSTGLYVWTDVGFGGSVGDVNGDDEVTSADAGPIQSRIDELDGGPEDGDGLMNGSVKIISFGSNFDRHDLNSDGVIDGADLQLVPAACRADFDTSGSLSAADIFGFLNAWFAGESTADFNASGSINAEDIFAFLNAWFLGC
ncbi:MAG: hypothetical protein K2W85_10620 [Phycisphaerales bacterium]|nr:hypothetical protein [Phycisphaerales bacterium]